MKATARTTRRRFLQCAAGLAAGALTAGPRAVGANERVHLGFIGLGAMGTGHLNLCAGMAGANITAACDVDASHRDRALSIVGGGVKTYTDFRHLLDNADTDAVVISTPEHWHPHITLAACAAGKDVYVEKPMGHNIREGRLMVDAALHHQRIVQVGLQQRSGQHWQEAVQRIRSGELGKVSMVHAWNAWNATEMRGGFGHPPDSPVPPGVDYDLWLGPAPLRPFNPARFHLYWCYFWDYSGGMVSGWGVHLFDIVSWAMGGKISSVAMSGGIHVLDDSRDTPDTAAAVFSCDGYTLNYTLRHANGWRAHDDMDHGIEFLGDRATLQINRGGYRVFAEDARGGGKPSVSATAEGNDYLAHFEDFLSCVRSRKEPRCTAQAGHTATNFSHLANIAYRTGRTLNWNPATESIADDAGANALLTRAYRAPWVL
jgi:predicted dehydrogenase